MKAASVLHHPRKSAAGVIRFNRVYLDNVISYANTHNCTKISFICENNPVSYTFRCPDCIICKVICIDNKFSKYVKCIQNCRFY